MKTADTLLRSREAQGIIWSMSARILFCSVVIALSIRNAVGFALFGGGIALAAYGIYLARRERHLSSVGLGGVGFDLALLSMIALIMQREFVAANASPGLILKTPILLAMVDLAVVNAMALRPLYPALLTAGSVVIQLVLMVFALGQQGVVVTTNAIEALSTPAVDRNRAIEDLATILIVGFFLTAMSHAARKLIRDVVELELRNQQIIAEQANMMMDFRMTGIANLVAGVAHELNTPLGASMSSANTIESCVNKLDASFDAPQDDSTSKQDNKVRRVLGLLKDSSRVVKDACTRMSSVVHSLKNFSRLDEAEVQESDIRAGLKSSLALITNDTKGSVRVIENYGDVPRLLCRPKELNQVFLSLLLHSFQAMKGHGTLSIDVCSEDDAITVSIHDTSDGIPDAVRGDLFEIGFGKKGARIGMGLELPTAKLVVEQHRGNISVESELGKGTRFLIRLPLQEIDSVTV